MKRSSFYHKFNAQMNLVNAIHNTPPTYHTGDVGNFQQFVPDPVSAAAVQNSMDEVEKARKAVDDLYKE